MKDNWRDFDKDDWRERESWNFDKYKPSTISEAYGNRKLNFPPSEIRWLKQLVVAIGLFFILLAVMSLENPSMISLQQGIKYLLVEERSDFTPVLEAVVRDGLWLDPYERQVFKSQNSQEVSRKESPMSIPVSGKYSRQFGWIESSVSGQKTFHAGIDIETELGAPVRAALDGTVIKIEETKNLGRTIEIDHGDGLITVYGTMGEILAEKDQEVKQGDIIGKTGTIIKSNKGQLHFEVRENGKAIDPLNKITNVRTSI